MLSISSSYHVSDYAHLQVLRSPLSSQLGCHHLAQQYGLQLQLRLLEQGMALGKVGRDLRVYRD